MRVVRQAALPVSRWANGAGRKADVAAGDGWTVGFAWLDQNAPFSDFSGMDRTITLVEGPGFTLDVAGRTLPVVVPFAPEAFDGGAPTRCRVAGACRVLNAMTARARLRHAVTILDRSGQIGAAGGAGCVVVALAGAATLHGAGLERLDAAVLGPEDGTADLVLPDGGRAAVVSITPA